MHSEVLHKFSFKTQSVSFFIRLVFYYLKHDHCCWKLSWADEVWFMDGFIIHKVAIFSCFISSSQCKRECFTNFNIQKKKEWTKSLSVRKLYCIRCDRMPITRCSDVALRLEGEFWHLCLLWSMKRRRGGGVSDTTKLWDSLFRNKELQYGLSTCPEV